MTEEIMESTLDSTPLSASESRKSTKPIMEKKRRARINASLTELKSLLLEVMKKEGTRHHKMEKADILEMTVKHLRMFQRQSFTAVSQDPAVANKYSSGFNECAGEVSRYLATTDGMEPELRTRLLNHLANCIQANNNNANNTQTTTVNSTVGTPVTAHVRPIQVQASVITTPGRLSPNSQVPKLTAVVPEINNNTVISSMQSFMPITATPIISQQNTNANVVSGLQVIPSRLANGEIAFVIPSNCLNTGQIPVIPLYNAGTAQTSPVSPTSPLSQMGESVSPCSSVSSLASPPPPVVIQPTIIAQAAQTPIMVPVTSSSTSAAPVTEATSPDSSTPTTPPNNTNTHQVITSSRQVASSPVQVMASPVAPSLIDCTFKPPAIASPQPIDFTKRAPEIQRANEVEVKADEEYKLNPLPPHQMAPSRDENMWRPW